MNAQEFSRLGMTLAGWLEVSAKNENYDWRAAIDDEFSPEILAQASALKARVERIHSLLIAPENADKLVRSPLLVRAADLPDFTSFNDRVIHFERLCQAIEDYQSSNRSWEEFLQSNQQRILDLWEEPNRREREYQEALLREKDQIQIEFMQNLARARANAPRPRRDAPCFAATSKNGLNCSRKTLVGIETLPSISLPEKKVEVSVKRCTECWQIYKEYCESDAATKQSRSRFLRPGQSDSTLGWSFTPSEAEEFGRIDFASILSPVLKSEPPIPLRSFMMHDIHPLYGGRTLWAVEGSVAIVQVAARYSGRGPELWEIRRRVRLEARDWAGVEQFAAERHFFTLAIEDRPGVPDEGRTVIEMVSKDGRRVRHEKWANTKHPDFEAIRQLLEQLSEKPGEPFWENPIDWKWRPEGF